MINLKNLKCGYEIEFRSIAIYIIINQYIHPFAGTSFSVGINQTREEITVNSYKSFLISTVTGNDFYTSMECVESKTG